MNRVGLEVNISLMRVRTGLDHDGLDFSCLLPTLLHSGDVLVLERPLDTITAQDSSTNSQVFPALTNDFLFH